MKNHGSIKLADGFEFHWCRMGKRENEIHGTIMNPQGGFVKGTSGWYRTDDPERASRLAVTKMKEMKI